MAHGQTWWSDTFAPLIELWKWIKSLFPTRGKLRWPQFNFIMVHYCYLIGTTILWSVMTYPAGNLTYTDALFFAAGCSTQSGLNTVDVNTLNTYQQVVYMIGCCLCTPVFINTVVVFVRLYWFERRFEHIVQEARANRRPTNLLSFTRSRSKSRARSDPDRDPSRLEKGIRGKPIEVLRNTIMKKPVARSDSEEEDKDGVLDRVETTSADHTPTGSSAQQHSDNGDEDIATEKAAAPSDADEDLHHARTEPSQSPSVLPTLRMTRGITFADEVENAEGIVGVSPPAPVEEHSGISKHIQFLERQKANAMHGGAYYIPGPREMDQGEAPQQLNRDEAMRRLHSAVSAAESGRNESIGDPAEHQSPEGERIGRGITIEEPDHPGHRDHGNEIQVATSARRDQSKSGLSHRRGHREMDLNNDQSSIARTSSRGKRANEDPMPYLSWTATTGRNSAFLGLTAEQRDELGGIEYRALKTLAGILISYFVGIHLLGMVVFLPWILNTPSYASIVQGDAQSPAWWGIFTPASLFNDLGLTLTPDSMISFQDSTLVLLLGSFLIVVGNTGFPCFLRFIIWALSHIALQLGGPESNLYLELRFLLDHPRRCFTLLFPSKATWWLFWVLVLLNGIDLVFFIILDINAPALTGLSAGYKVLNGWFQAVSTRTAGFASVNLADLHAGIQVSYLVMMYISVFPIAISVRRTNVYEEKSLGVFGGEEEANGEGEQSYVSQHLRRQLSFDLWYIFLGLFIITIVEGDRIANVNQPAFTTFSVLFEVVSAYGTVGLSLGYPGVNASFSSQFRVISKLVICAMMIRGRHRGLPYALDRAILLPSEKLQQKEAEEGERMLRRGSALTQRGDWQDGFLDDNGLPRQYTAMADPMVAGAGGEVVLEGLHPINTRRSTAVSTRSQADNGKRGRSRSLSRFIAGGLSAGPTLSKRD